MSNIAIRAEHLSKYYRLGVINNGVLFRDIQTWIALKRGKTDPHSKIGENKYDGTADGFWALKDLNFEIKQGDRVGIIGKNGAGKSTLLKILSRITAPTEGKVKIKGRVASLLEVGTGFHKELTGRENIYLNGAILGMKKKEVDRKIDEIIDFSGIEQHIDTPVKRYSSGMYVRLAFAVAAHLDSEILIADEVLAVGDAEFQNKALGKMNELSTGQGRTVLFVSHNMTAVKGLCNKGMVLEKGKIKFESGNIDEAIGEYLREGDKRDLNERVFDSRILKHACIYQENDNLVLTIKYNKDFLPEPYLGFVLYDMAGHPIFGLNPRNINRSLQCDRDKGTIILEIISPNLISDTYSISLYLGDIAEDMEIYQHCLNFAFCNSQPLKYPYVGGRSGYIVPTVNYLYN